MTLELFCDHNTDILILSYMNLKNVQTIFNIKHEKVESWMVNAVFRFLENPDKIFSGNPEMYSTLTHLRPMFPFYTPLKTLLFCGCIKWENWSKMDSVSFKFSNLNVFLPYKKDQLLCYLRVMIIFQRDQQMVQWEICIHVVNLTKFYNLPSPILWLD